MTNTSPPQNPAGEFVSENEYSEATKARLIQSIKDAPQKLRETVAGLNDEQLDTLYRNWTIRQIVHHIADSHLNSLVRFKWTLTEDHPTIKAYVEGDWVQLADAKSGDIEPSLALLDALHSKWVQLLETMTEEQFRKQFHHPQTNEDVDLWTALNSYAWHGKHHTAQIAWLGETHDW